jgi:hypothetical protein
MQYRYFERISNSAQRTDVLFTSEAISASAASHERDIGKTLGWEGDIRAITVDSDPGSGTVQLPEPPPPPDRRTDNQKTLDAARDDSATPEWGKALIREIQGA